MVVKFRKIIILATIFAFVNSITVVAFAENSDIEESKIIWSCKELYGGETILWLVEWGSKSYVKVFDERISARYTMDGLEKRWDWGLDGSDYSYDYAITLDPSRTAKYFDFTASKDGTASARNYYKCAK